MTDEPLAWPYDSKMPVQPEQTGTCQCSQGPTVLPVRETIPEQLQGAVFKDSVPFVPVVPAKNSNDLEIESGHASKNLAEMDPAQTGIPYCEWKAQQLNRLFLEHGATPHQPGSITAATVADGLSKLPRERRLR